MDLSLLLLLLILSGRAIATIFVNAVTVILLTGVN
jgi:hypothetical protein